MDGCWRGSVAVGLSLGWVLGLLTCRGCGGERATSTVICSQNAPKQLMVVLKNGVGPTKKRKEKKQHCFQEQNMKSVCQTQIFLMEPVISVLQTWKQALKMMY